MNKSIATFALTLALSALTYSQTAKGTQTICKGSAIPDGFTIIGEAESPNCPNKAWVVKQRGTPKLTMPEPVPNIVTPQPEDRAGGTERSSSPDSTEPAVAFAKRAFELLLQGDLAVEEMVDWDHLKLDGKDFGTMLRQTAAAFGKDPSSVRREMILAFGMQYKESGEGPLTSWRIHTRNVEGTTVAANAAKGLIILFTVSERGGKQIISALSETK